MKQSIILGDCFEVFKDLPAESFDAVVTSPPYNLGIGYASYEDHVPYPAYLEKMQVLAQWVDRVLKPEGHLFLNVGGSSKEPWIPLDVALQFRRLKLQNMIVWAKSVTVGETTTGHFKPINSKRFLNHVHEFVFHFTKSGEVPVDRLAVGVPFADKSNIARRGHAADRRCGGDLWFIPYETAHKKADKFDHPAGFPVDLPRRCLKLTGVEDGRVLDPFAGTGTTLVAAQELGWHGVGIELDPTYADAAFRRVQIVDTVPTSPRVAS